MSDRLVMPGQSTAPVIGPDGRLYELRVEGSGEVTPGPLRRFIALADQIAAEGGDVPPEIRDVLLQLAERKDAP